MRRDDPILLHTSAPDCYDGFGTTTLAVVGRDLWRKNPVRLVAVRSEHYDWQTERYASGLYPYTDRLGRVTTEMLVKWGNWELDKAPEPIAEGDYHLYDRREHP